MSLPGTFRVDVEELSRISGRLDESVEGMSTVSRRLDQASAGQLGHGSLDAACADFQEKWKYGMAQISKLASSIRGSVDATAEAYRTCDAGIQQAFSRTPAPSDAHGGTTASAGRASAFG